MKSPLVYLTLHKLKNQIKELFKHPARLIYVLFLVGIFALSAFSGEEIGTGEPRSLSELVAIMALFYTFMFLLVFLNGSSTNTPMFTLSDVTLLFPAPLSPNKILFYGLLRQLGLSLLLGFFLLFQYSWLNGVYGVTYGGLLLIVAGYAVTLFLAQLLSMAVYTRTSGNERAGRTVRLCVYGTVILYVLAAVFACREPLTALLNGGNDYFAVLDTGTKFFSTLPGLLFPVSGWAAGIVGGIFLGDSFLFVLLSVVSVLFLIVLILLILGKREKHSYYEDVLQTAETARSAIAAQKEGNLDVVPKHVRLGKTGLGRGWGASAVYYKHTIENRRSGVFFLSTMSLIFAVCIILASFFMRDMEDGAIVGIFAMGTYMQLFSTALGRFNRELTKPYLYLIPEPPLKKLIFSLLESLRSNVLEAVIIFVPVGFILQATPLDVFLCIAARVTFALLFTAGNVLVERVFGTVSSKTLIILFYFLALLLMAVPGIVLGIVLLFVLPGFLGLFLGMAAANVPIALLVLYLCRNLLQYAELNNR